VTDLLDGRVMPVSFIQEPKALRGVGGMLRILMSERSFFSRPRPLA